LGLRKGIPTISETRQTTFPEENKGGKKYEKGVKGANQYPPYPGKNENLFEKERRKNEKKEKRPIPARSGRVQETSSVLMHRKILDSEEESERQKRKKNREREKEIWKDRGILNNAIRKTGHTTESI